MSVGIIKGWLSLLLSATVGRRDQPQAISPPSDRNVHCRLLPPLLPATTQQMYDSGCNFILTHFYVTLLNRADNYLHFVFWIFSFLHVHHCCDLKRINAYLFFFVLQNMQNFYLYTLILMCMIFPLKVDNKKIV